MIQSLSFMGITSSTGQNRHIYVVLNELCEVTSMGNVSRNDLVYQLEQFPTLIAAINLPSQINPLLRQYAYNQENFIPIDFSQLYAKKPSENEVSTSSHEKSRIPIWFQRNRRFIDKLLEIGFSPYPKNLSHKQWFSGSAELSYRRLLNTTPYVSRTIEGRIQRQLFLYNLGIHVPDPMGFFEEITRHRLLQSTLLYDSIIAYPELDAYILAYLAWLTNSHPQNVNIIDTHTDEKLVFPITGMNISSRHIK